MATSCSSPNPPLHGADAKEPVVPAILFGSIGTIVDTSELQREAFNEAFAQHDLEWKWDRVEYQSMLDTSGGCSRIAEYARQRSETVDASAIHATKSDCFQVRMSRSGLVPRAGVADAIHAAKSNGYQVALVTTTSPSNVRALFAGLSSTIDANLFDLIVDASQVDAPKPHPAAYTFAIERLGVAASNCVAVEDNLDGLTAALAAGVSSVAFPNANTADHDFTAAVDVVESVDFARLQEHLSAR
ncbi:MAG: HAD superfamily hydrolase (TIGR01509 family) [Ilumatobacter sp.]|jgi:HAD superfamily hydrolase (TIGR01509 family)